MHADTIIIGAGMAGLAAAGELARAGQRVTVLEASDGVGGRVRSDMVEGFILDRGFQVYLSAYPHAGAVLDHGALELCPFEPGAAVWFGGKMHVLMDPLRRPGSLLDGALSSVGTLGDKLKVGLLRAELQRGGAGGWEDFWRTLYSGATPERTIKAELVALGFSAPFIDRFWRPFMGGITFDTGLGASSRMMRFVMRCMGMGDTCVPRLGMGQISAQLARAVPAGALHLGTPAQAIDGTTVHTPAGRFTADRVILATGAHDAQRLLDVPSMKVRAWRGVTTLSFALPASALPAGPAGGPLLVLDGEGTGPVTNLAFMSSVSSAYAPPGQALAVATVIGARSESDAQLGELARAQMRGWFGARVDAWRLLHVRRIARALPDQSPPWLTQRAWPCEVPGRPGVLLAGDSHDTASIDGAILSGLRAARAALGAGV